MNNLIYFLSSQSRVFSALWSFSSPSSKAPFKSVIILLFRWGEDYSGIRQHHFNNVIIFRLLFSVPFTKQANISASLTIPFYPWIAAEQHQDALMLWAPSELMLLVKNPVKNTWIPLSSLINIYLSALVSICHSIAFSPGHLVGLGLWLTYLCHLYLLLPCKFISFFRSLLNLWDSGFNTKPYGLLLNLCCEENSLFNTAFFLFWSTAVFALFPSAPSLFRSSTSCHLMGLPR